MLKHEDPGLKSQQHIQSQAQWYEYVTQGWEKQRQVDPSQEFTFHPIYPKQQALGTNNAVSKSKVKYNEIR